MNNIISISNLNKRYPDGLCALQDVDLDIRQGEIFALLGPNGAGKTSLISIICGLVNATSGTVLVEGKDIVRDYRHTRSQIGLVPQELTTDAFITVWDAVNFSRGLFGKGPKPEYLEKILKSLSLWDKKDSRLMTLSGGMKRRLMIAKALAHEPRILFLDEPTAGVDVELRKDMWEQVHALRAAGVTIILTTHYIEEAEEMADRIGIINSGRLVLVEEKAILMKKLGRKELSVELPQELKNVPDSLSAYDLKIEGQNLVLSYDSQKEDNGIAIFLQKLESAGIDYRDLNTRQSSLEEIFVELVKKS